MNVKGILLIMSQRQSAFVYCGVGVCIICVLWSWCLYYLCTVELVFILFVYCGVVVSICVLWSWCLYYLCTVELVFVFVYCGVGVSICVLWSWC